MIKLIIFHPGVNFKQKLYLFYTYCFCYYIDSILYFLITFKRNRHFKKTWGGKGSQCFLRDFDLVHKDLKKISLAGKRGAKVGKKLRKMITPTKKAKMIQKEKDQLYSHIIKNCLGFKQGNKILKIAGILGNSGNDLLKYVTTNIDFIYWYKKQPEEIKRKLSFYEYDNEK